MSEVFYKIFKQPRYIILSTIIFVAIMIAALILPNINLLISISALPETNFGEVLILAFKLAGSIKTNFTILSAINTILTALLFGINISIISYYIKGRKEILKKSGMATSTLGLIAGVLGIGCASCGSLLISILGIGGALTFLPFEGQEFGVIGVALLLFSAYTLLNTINKPFVCEVKE